MEIYGILQSIAAMGLACFFGVFIANLLVSLGLAKLISKPLSPLMKLANLPSLFSIPAIVSIVDIRGGLSIVASIKNEKIDDSAIVAYSLVTRPLSTVSFLLRYYLPVTVVALGLSVGFMYIALSFLAAFISMLIGLIYGRMKVKRSSVEPTFPENLGNDFSQNLKNSLNSAITMTKKVLIRYSIIVIAVSALFSLGFFDFLSKEVDVYAKKFGFSSSFATILSLHILSPTSSVLAAGEFLKKGLINAKECLIALLIGRFLFTALMDYPRHSFPFYASIFPLKLATKLVMAGIVVNAISTPILVLIVSFI